MTEEIEGMVPTADGRHAIMIDPANDHFGWCFFKDANQMWVSMRVATAAEYNAAKLADEAAKVPKPVIGYHPPQPVAWRYKTGSGIDDYEFTKYQLDNSFRRMGAGEHEYVKGEALVLQPKQGTLYTFDDREGTFEDMGVAIGDGVELGELVQVFRNTHNGQLHFRDPEDFVGHIKETMKP